MKNRALYSLRIVLPAVPSITTRSSLIRGIVCGAISLAATLSCNEAVAPTASVSVPDSPRLTIVTSRTPALEAADQTTCGLKSDGSIVCWGYDGYEQTTPPSGLGKVLAIAGGGNHECAIKANSAAVCWGDDFYGQSTVPGDLGPVAQFGLGAWSTCAVKPNGSVRCWGKNDNGETTLPEGLSGVTQVQGGDYFYCARKSNGTVKCWGNNGQGQTTVPGGLSGVTQIETGFAFACALKSDGTVACWGYNGEGETDVPSGLNGVLQISAGGGSHTCALKSNHTVVCWGKDEFGQTDIPDKLTLVSQITTGGFHSCALKSNGKVVCWGLNNLGQTAVPPALNLIAHVLPVAILHAPLAVAPGDPISLTLSDAHAPGYPAVTTFRYSFSCGDGSGYSAFSSTNTASCPTTVTGIRHVGGKVQDPDGDVQGYMGTVEIGDFHSTCMFSRSSDTQATITVSWSYANPGATEITFASGPNTAIRTRVPSVSGSSSVTLRWLPTFASTPAYGLKGGVNRRDASATLTAAGTACTEQP